MSPSVEAWMTRRGMRLTPLGELVIIGAAGLGMLAVVAVTIIAVVAIGAGLGVGA